jgi:hypothetical protein
MLAEYRLRYTNNVNYYHSRYVAQSHNPFGFVTPYEPAGGYGNSAAGNSMWLGAAWMQDFLTASVGYAKDLGLGLGSATHAKLDAFFAWKVKSIIGRLGGPNDAGGYLYRDYAPYNMALAPIIGGVQPNWDTGAGPWYSDWRAIYAATFSGAEPNATQNNGPYGSQGAYADGDIRTYLNPEFPAAEALPAIAYAIKHGVAGAQAAFDRLRAASNWTQFLADLDVEPVWAVSPTAVTR